MVKVLIKIFLPFFLGSFFALWAFSFAHADEPDYGQEITITSTDVSMNLYGYYYTGSNIPSAFSASSTYVRSDLRSYQFRTGSGWDSAFQCALTYQQLSDRLPLLDKSFTSSNYGNAVPINISDVSFSVDYTLPSLAGWYTCTYDVYLGVGVGLPRNNVASYCINSFTVDGSADFYTDSEGHPFILQYVDTVQSTFTAGGNTMRFDLLHFQAIYQGDHIDETLSLNLYDYLRNHIAGWQASGVYGNGYSIAAYSFQSFVDMHVYYMAEPPATPTPIPTPYPGQDTQESINQGVSNIEGQMNQLINSLNPVVSPVPTPADFTIDETLFDELESMTLPDVSSAEDTFSSLWEIFNPLWWLLALLFSVTFVIGIFLYVLRGGFI